MRDDRSQPSADQLLQSVTDLGRVLFRAAACSLAVLEADEEHLVFRAASGAGAAEVIGVRLPVNKGIAGWVVSSGQPIAVDDVRRDPRFARDVAESTGFVPTSILAGPMDSPADTIGVIEVLDRTPAGGRDDFALLEVLSRHAELCLRMSGGPDGPEGAAGSALDVASSFGELGPVERAAAAALLRDFLTHARGQGGPAGVV